MRRNDFGPSRLTRPSNRIAPLDPVRSNRRLASVLAGLGMIVVVATAAAWLLPGMLDWSRYRQTITTLASIALGQDVRIEGDIALQVLPQPVLSARGISLADEEHGARLSAKGVRLSVAFWPLLAGRIEPRELLLRGPDAALDWPLKGLSLANRPAWLDGMRLRVIEGTLRIGGVVLSDIAADLMPDPLTGTIGLDGTAKFSERSWRFSTRLGTPGGDGAAPFDLVLDGAGPVQDTGGTFSGLIAADGRIEGRMEARGRDLSQLLPAPAVTWRAEGRLSASEGLAIADDLALQFANSPARGAVALRVSPAPRLDLALVASRIDLDAWLPVLMGGSAGRLPTGIDLSAEAATLAGGTLRDLRGGFDLGAEGVRVRDASAVLPGEARVDFAGMLTQAGSAGARFAGQGWLRLPDLRTTMSWLSASGVPLPKGLPPDVLHAAEFTASIAADRVGIVFSGLDGVLDGVTARGTLRFGFQPRPSLGLDLALDRLLLDPWMPVRLPGLAEVPSLFSANPAELKLSVGQVDWRGMALRQVGLDAGIADGVLIVRRIEALLPGARVSVSGSVGEAGRLADARLDLTAENGAELARLLPAEWAGLRLWDLPLRVNLLAAGPPEALALRIGADVAEGRLEAQPVLNLPAGTAAGRVFLRHPGAPRLLDLVGLAGAQAWIGEGSLALGGQLAYAPGRLTLDGFDLTAALLRTGGQLTLDLTGSEPALSGQLKADALPLPPLWPDAGYRLPVAALRGWTANMRVDAAQIASMGSPVLRQAGFTLSLDSGTLRIEGLRARLAGGEAAGRLEFTTTSAAPSLIASLAVAGAMVEDAPLGWPVDIQAGRLDATLDLRMSGFSTAALLASASGTARLEVRDGALRGVDLGALAHALGEQQVMPRPPVDRAALAQALANGLSPVTLLRLGGTLNDGNLALHQTEFAGPAGSGTIAGSIGLTGPTLDLRLALRPDLHGTPGPDLAVRLNGPAMAPQRIPELAGLTAWEASQPR